MPGRRAVVARARFGKIEAPIFTQRMRESRIPVGGAEKPRWVLGSPGGAPHLCEDEREDHEPAFHGSFLCCFTGAPGFCPGLVPQRLHAGQRTSQRLGNADARIIGRFCAKGKPESIDTNDYFTDGVESSYDLPMTASQARQEATARRGRIGGRGSDRSWTRNGCSRRGRWWWGQSTRSNRRE